MANDKEFKQLEQILKNRKKYVIRKDATSREIDAVNGTLKQLYDAFATLLDDLKKQGIIL